MVCLRSIRNRSMSLIFMGLSFPLPSYFSSGPFNKFQLVKSGCVCVSQQHGEKFQGSRAQYCQGLLMVGFINEKGKFFCGMFIRSFNTSFTSLDARSITAARFCDLARCRLPVPHLHSAVTAGVNANPPSRLRLLLLQSLRQYRVLLWFP